MTQRGPRVLITVTCHGCEHLSTTRYEAMGERCWSDRCVLEGRQLDDLATPDWCPLREEALARAR